MYRRNLGQIICKNVNVIEIYRNICKERFDSIPELARATEVVLELGSAFLRQLGSWFQRSSRVLLRYSS